MLSITHTLISLPFAFYLRDPLLIFLSALVMHLIADTFLHWNIYPQNFKRYPIALVALDVLGGLFVAFLLTGEYFFTLPVWLAIAGGNLPDVLHGLWDLADSKTKQRAPQWLKVVFRFHHKLQLETTSLPRGLAWQIVFAAFAIFSIR